MFIQHIEKLIETQNSDEEALALGELLSAAKNSDIHYGYRVFNKTRNKRAMPDELDGMLEDELIVTIFVGEQAPYREFEWRPRDNGHITRLVMP